MIKILFCFIIFIQLFQLFFEIRNLIKTIRELKEWDEIYKARLKEVLEDRNIIPINLKRER